MTKFTDMNIMQTFKDLIDVDVWNYVCKGTHFW